MTFSDISDELVGEKGDWEIPGSEDTLSFSGTFLAFSSSRKMIHDSRAHPGGTEKNPIPIMGHDGKPIRCSACRWSEFRLFKEDEKGIGARWPYIIHFTGMSIVPGEHTRFRIVDILTAREVIENLTTRRGGSAYLSVPAARLLAQAAEIDNGPLKEAYDARRVP